MDIDLLAKMVKEVVMDHDSVTLPGVGSFVAELVPSTFTDRGYTILPPYRRLYFSPRQGEDSLLVDLYCASNPEATEADARRILIDFLAEMKEVLKVRKTIIFPGLGRLRATRENHFFFVADEDLDIYPAGFGLEPISLKTHEETQEEVAAAVANLAGMLEVKSEPEPEPEPEPVAPAPEIQVEFVEEASAEAEAPAEPEEPVVSTESEQPAEPEDPVTPEDPAAPEAPATAEAPRKSRWWLWTLLVLLGVAVLLLATLAVVGRVAPEWLDYYLYSAEELEVLHP